MNFFKLGHAKEVLFELLKEIKALIQKGKALLSIINIVYDLLKNIWVVILFLILFGFAFIAVDQGQDLMKGLSFTGRGLWNILFILVAINWFSFNIFRATELILMRFTFIPENYRPKENLAEKLFKNLAKWVSHIPFLLFIAGLYKASGGLSVLAMLVFLNLIQYSLSIKIIFQKELNSLSTWQIDFSSIFKSKTGSQLIRRAIYTLAIFVFFVFSTPAINKYIGATAIIMFAFGAWLAIASILYIMRNVTKIPFVAFIFIYPFAISSLTNNHEIKIVDTNKDIAKRESLETDFSNWYNKTFADSINTIKHKDSAVIYLVSGEGGGIRAAYFTAQFLSKLHEINPQFTKQVYGISTVSGSSVGVGMYYNLLVHKEREMVNKSKQILRIDFLSHLTAKMTFADMLQRFIPFPIKRFSRARGLENDFAQTFHHIAGYIDTGNGGYLNTTLRNKELPRLLINSTNSENGNRAIISPFALGTAFYNTNDIFETTKRDIDFYTCLSLSSRFAYFTPAGLIKDYQTGEEKYSAVDGGYFENSGAYTMLDLYNKLKTLVKGKKVKFHFIVLKNSKKETKQYKAFLNETTTPFRTFYSAWNARGYDAMHTVDDIRKRDNCFYSYIELERKDEETIPLGWALSDEAAKLIDEKVNAIFTIETENILHRNKR